LTLPRRFPRRWNIAAADLIAETFSSRIWKVARADGSPAVVKALKPFDDVEDELRGAYFLRWRDGHGAVRLLGRDRLDMLLDYAGERHLTAVLDSEGDAAATEIAAEIMARLHAPSRRKPPSGLQPLRKRFAALFDKARTDAASGTTSLYGEAAAIAERLLSDPRDVRPLHGDLHHDNIMEGERGWLAIDPKGVSGDSGFDAANLFYNPLDRDDLCLSPDRIAHMATVFSLGMGHDPRRLLDHTVAYGALSAAWHAGDSNDLDEQRELAVASAIRAVRLSF